jgi:hypothetical protein
MNEKSYICMNKMNYIKKYYYFQVHKFILKAGIERTILCLVSMLLVAPTNVRVMEIYG